MDRAVGNFDISHMASAQWSPTEALEQAAAALPDASFGKRYGIEWAALERVQDTLAEAKHGKTKNVMNVLRDARDMIPKAWATMDQPVDLLRALDRAIVGGHLEAIKDLPQAAIVESQYEADADFAAALNALIPDFEYPNHAHQTIEQIGQVAQKEVVKSTLAELSKEGIEVPDSGRFIGKAVAIFNGVVVQHAGRETLVAHDLSRHDSEIKRGQMLDLTYGPGKAIQVAAGVMPQQGLSRD